MVTLLRKDKAQGVVIHKIDRSARNLRDWAGLGELIDQGIEVHFAHDPIDLRSRGGRLSADIQAVVAADYIRNLREEAKKGIYGRLKQGFYPLRAPLGYCDNGAAKPKTVHPEKGPLVRKAFELYASGRFNILSLGDELFRLGLRNNASGPVTRNGLSTILNNPFYMGLIRIRKTGQMFPGNHEPLVSRRLFEDVQNALQGRFARRTKIHDFLFRRLIKCKLCGYSLIGEMKKGHIYYRCHTQDCPTTGIREDCVAAYIESSLEKLQFNKVEREYLGHAIEALKQNWAEERERHVSALKARLEQAGERLKRLTDAYLDHVVDRDVFEERKTALLLERRAMEDQLNSIKSATPDAIGKFLELVGNTCFLYKMAILPKKRRLLKILTSNFTLADKTLDFTFSQPFREVANRECALDGGPSKAIHRTVDALLASLENQSEACMAAVQNFENED